MTPLDKPILFLATMNAKRSRAFYEQVLELAFVADEPPALVFRVGDSMLRIQKVERIQKLPYTALGWACQTYGRPCGNCARPESSFSATRAWRQDDDNIWRSPSGALVAWFEDPDGNLLSLTQFP